MVMRFGSVCSGIEAASVAWGPLGWQAAWFAEIEAFPSAVLAHHYPEVKNLGDMTQIPALIQRGEVEAPDILCGGTPCQAFSVAGLRRSLDDARGNLSLTFCEIANAIDSVRAVRGERASIVFWENVPGVLSTADNAFGCFLAGLAGEDEPLVAPGGKWTDAGVVLGPTRAVAWRILDAQYFGLAQRRRRVFVVASARDDFDPAAVLLEWDGVRRDSAPSREAGEGIANALTDRADRGGTNSEGQRLIPQSVAKTVCAGGHSNNPLDENLLPVAFQETADCLTAAYGTKWNGNASADNGSLFVAQPVGIFQDSEFGVQQYDSAGTLRAGRIPEHQMVMQPVAIRPDATPKWQDDLAFTLTQPSPTGGGHPQAIAFHPTQDPISSTDICHSISSGNGQGCATAAIAFDPYNQACAPVTHTLRKGRSATGDEIPQTVQGMQVRRLTPVECERLQGFPDNYTAIPWRKKPASECPDGPRYKALGNSWAVPVVRWIGWRIECLSNLV